MNDYSKLEKALNYEFKNKGLLVNALTHSSYANEKGGREGESNERLEFLGDAVLEVIISEYLFVHFPGMQEGEMTRLRSSLVCEKALSTAEQTWNLGESLRLGRGEALSGGRTRPSIIADASEAVIAAAFLDGGFPAARVVIRSLMDSPHYKNYTASFIKDAKTELQELMQKTEEADIKYNIVGESGPAHLKRFEAEVEVNGKILGRGSGHNKKEAESAAAADALQKL